MTAEEFIRVYLPLGKGLYRVAFRLLGSQEEAEDAVQDLYLKVWAHREELDRVNNPQAWTLILLRNLCIDRLRARPGQRAVSDPESVPAEEAPERNARLEQVLKAGKYEPLLQKQDEHGSLRLYLKAKDNVVSGFALVRIDNHHHNGGQFICIEGKFPLDRFEKIISEGMK